MMIFLLCSYLEATYHFKVSKSIGTSTNSEDSRKRKNDLVIASILNENTKTSKRLSFNDFYQDIQEQVFLYSFSKKDSIEHCKFFFLLALYYNSEKIKNFSLTENDSENLQRAKDLLFNIFQTFSEILNKISNLCENRNSSNIFHKSTTTLVYLITLFFNPNRILSMFNYCKDIKKRNVVSQFSQIDLTNFIDWFCVLEKSFYEEINWEKILTPDFNRTSSIFVNALFGPITFGKGAIFMLKKYSSQQKKKLFPCFNIDNTTTSFKNTFNDITSKNCYKSVKININCQSQVKFHDSERPTISSSNTETNIHEYSLNINEAEKYYIAFYNPFVLVLSFLLWNIQNIRNPDLVEKIDDMNSFISEFDNIFRKKNELVLSRLPVSMLKKSKNPNINRTIIFEQAYENEHIFTKIMRYYFKEQYFDTIAYACLEINKKFLKEYDASLRSPLTYIFSTCGEIEITEIPLL